MPNNLKVHYIPANPPKREKASRYLLPCKYKQHGAAPKPDYPGVSSDKVNSYCTAMAFVRRLYGYCDKQDRLITKRI